MIGKVVGGVGVLGHVRVIDDTKECVRERRREKLSKNEERRCETVDMGEKYGIVHLQLNVQIDHNIWYFWLLKLCGKMHFKSF